MQEKLPSREYTYHWYKAKPSPVKCRAGFMRPYKWDRKRVTIKEALLTWFKYKPFLSCTLNMPNILLQVLGRRISIRRRSRQH